MKIFIIVAEISLNLKEGQMKSATFAIMFVLSTSFCLAAGDKSGLGLLTDFKIITPKQILKLLEDAGTIRVDTKGTSFSVDDESGKKPPYSGLRDHIKACNGGNVNGGATGEDACFQIFQRHQDDALHGRLSEADSRYVASALIRGCGVYALAEDRYLTRGGRTCGLLGVYLAAIDNQEAARAVWEFAPGCYSQDWRAGTPVNGCIGDALYNRSVFASAPQDLLEMMRQSCKSIHDRESCEYLESQGETVDMAAVAEEENERHEAIQENRESNIADLDQARAQSEARRNALFSALQSMPGANDPNAVLDAGNRQAAAMRSIGDANAAQQRAAAVQPQPQQSTAATQVPQVAQQQSSPQSVYQTYMQAAASSSQTPADSGILIWPSMAV
jgi:hypothetical protein